MMLFLIKSSGILIADIPFPVLIFVTGFCCFSGFFWQEKIKNKQRNKKV
jgi:hypothetical protein